MLDSALFEEALLAAEHAFVEIAKKQMKHALEELKEGFTEVELNAIISPIQDVAKHYHGENVDIFDLSEVASLPIFAKAFVLERVRFLFANDRF